MAGNKKSAPWLLIGGGALTAGAIWWSWRKSDATVSSIERAIAGTDGPRMPDGTGGGLVNVRLTGYWPYQSGLSATERKMEGGTNDRKGKPIHTLEQHQKDPVNHPYVSVAGDDAVWPYGQRIMISAWPNLIFRVVDTGSHFRGAGKLYRVLGHEPLDIAVDSSKTIVPKSGVTVKIVPGDNFAKGMLVATGKMQGQKITGEETDAGQDAEVLARALESELGGRPQEEQLAAAWAMRNRAENNGTSVCEMLTPKGECGPSVKSGGYASTRRAATDKSRQIANDVLSAPVYEDPTGGAVEFWVPEQQDKLRQLGDIHRAAKKSGDKEKAKKYERYAGYGTEGDVRVKQAHDGLRVLRAVGVVELLGKIG